MTIWRNLNKQEIEKLNDWYEAKLRELDVSESNAKLMSPKEPQGFKNDKEIASI